MDDLIVGYKLLVSYNVNTDNVQAYQQFVMGRYIPVLQSMGLHIQQAWHTAYGSAPNRLLEFVCEDRDTLTTLLESDTWEDLNQQLTEYVANLNHKSIPYREGFQL